MSNLQFTKNLTGGNLQEVFSILLLSIEDVADLTINFNRRKYLLIAFS
jgi:hypothetical protein